MRDAERQARKRANRIGLFMSGVLAVTFAVVFTLGYCHGRATSRGLDESEANDD